MNSYIRIPTKEAILAMVAEENQCRRSQEYIDRCSAVKDEPDGWLRITAEMQQDIARQFGFITEIENDIAVNRLRMASQLYPDEPVVREAIQVANNKARKGELRSGDTIPDIIIHDIEGNEMNIRNLCDPEKQNIIFGASHT